MPPSLPARCGRNDAKLERRSRFATREIPVVTGGAKPCAAGPAKHFVSGRSHERAWRVVDCAALCGCLLQPWPSRQGWRIAPRRGNARPRTTHREWSTRRAAPMTSAGRVKGGVEDRGGRDAPTRRDRRIRRVDRDRRGARYHVGAANSSTNAREKNRASGTAPKPELADAAERHAANAAMFGEETRLWTVAPGDRKRVPTAAEAPESSIRTKQTNFAAGRPAAPIRAKRRRPARPVNEAIHLANR